MSVPGVHSVAVLFFVRFLFGSPTMVLELGILVDILSYFVPFPLVAQINWSAATPFRVLLFQPQYACVTAAAADLGRWGGDLSGAAQLGGAACLPECCLCNALKA